MTRRPAASPGDAAPLSAVAPLSGGAAGPAVLEAEPQVWVATGRVDGKPAGRPHPGDLAVACGLPDWRAREFLAGRALLRALLAVVRPAAAGAAVSAGRNGKPFLAGHPSLGVSVSHDGPSVAVCVGAGRAVGIDVQHPPEQADDVLVRRCAAGHRDHFATLAPAGRGTELAWIWTAQEACVKAVGSGLSGRPWTIDVPPGGLRGTWHDVHWRSLREVSAVPLSYAWRRLRPRVAEPPA
ncbi:4'-phosphopantetheinyl transferase family protein [Streptomyces sp. JW3]|uniref:4'-phosphopantetheinyl transferase family protein n=1 Tax=Streptomyces sp. JW3 TaxID=3456955 RepID=UPI003FA43BF0